jgi:tetratricopeptide (TPR) repeat protein
MPVRAKLKKLYYKAAVLLGRTRLKFQPESDDSRLQLAHAQIKQEEWQAALDLATQVLQQHPKNAEAYRVLAEAHHGQGELKLALEEIQTAIELDPKVSWFYHALGRIYVAEERYTEAIVALEKAVTLDDNVSWFQFNLGEARLKDGDWQGAIGPLARSVQLNPIFGWSYYYLAEAYLNLENFPEAIAQYRKAVLTAPDISYMHDALAYAKHLQWQDEQIQAFCQRPKIPDRPRALLLTPYPPFPPKLGGATRMFYEMQALHAKTELVVVCFGFVKGDFRLETDLAKFSQLALTVASGDRPSRLPSQAKVVHRYSSHRMTKVLTALNQADFDLVVMDFIYVAQYRSSFPNSFAVLSEHNIESQILRRCAEAKPSDTSLRQVAAQVESIQVLVDAEAEAIRLEAFEDAAWPTFSLRTVVSEQDKAILDRRAGGGKTIVVSNGINTAEIQPFPDQSIPRILFMGTLNYYPNIDGATYLVNEILPAIWQLHPTIECWIAGAEPPQQVYDLIQDSRVKIIANPDSMEDLAQQCCMTIVPLRLGGGTRIKILHSLAMGLPVVTTSLGCEGLNVVDGSHLLIRDEPAEFATAVVQLVEDATLRQTLRQQGRELVEQQYDWNQIFDRAVNQMLTAQQSHQL